MRRIPFMFVLATCLIGGMLARGAGLKASPALRVTPAQALVDEVVSVSIGH